MGLVHDKVVHDKVVALTERVQFFHCIRYVRQNNTVVAIPPWEWLLYTLVFGINQCVKAFTREKCS